MPHPELVGLAFLPFLVGTTMLANGVSRWRRWRVRPHWQRTRAEITAAAMVGGSAPAGGRWFSYRYPRIEYEYRVGGMVYTAPLLQELVERAPGRSRKRGYRIGTPLEVWYDPAAPERSVPTGHVEWSAPVSLALGATLLLLSAWLAWTGAHP